MIKICIFSIIFIANTVSARSYVDIVGSSTVFPFATVVAEVFGKKTGLATPKIEATGSGGGMKLFCKGGGINTPDIVNTSRRIKKTELNRCHKNGVSNITEVLIGFDGIAIANSKKGLQFDLTLRDLYLALAAKIPDEKTGKLIKNPYTNWQQIRKNLPAATIKVLGPPPTSGTRDALQEIALEGGCKTYDVMQKMQKTDSSKYHILCQTVREDGVFVELGENDNLIVSKLSKDKNTIGIFGFSFLEQNFDKVKGAKIDGKPITFENIASGDYPISRPLYFYVKNSHRRSIKGLGRYIEEFMSEDSLGEDGYLADKGLISPPDKLRKKIAAEAISATILKL